jgi:hypothetical protein
MNQITESLYAEKIAEMSSQIETMRRLMVALVYEVGKGKNVSISKGNQKQADQKVGSIEFRQLATGEIRFTVHKPKETE